MKSEDALDIVILLLLLATLLSVGLTALVRERNRTEAYNSVYVNDKNVKAAKITQDVFGESSGEYTLDEVMLAFQIQNFYMQSPKMLSISYVDSTGKTIMMEPVEVTAVFEADRDIYCEWVNKFISDYVLEGRNTKENRDKLRFTLEIDNGDDLADKNDDFYVFREVQ